MPSHVQGCEDLPYRGYSGIVKVFTWPWSSKPKCIFFIFNKTFIFSVFISMHICTQLHTHTHTLPKNPEEDIKPPQVSVIVGCEPAAMGLALDSSTLEEQQALITTKLPLQQPFLFLNLYLVPTLNLQLKPNNYTVNEIR